MDIEGQDNSKKNTATAHESKKLFAAKMTWEMYQIWTLPG
jgi:hypothetical protein